MIFPGKKARTESLSHTAREANDETKPERTKEYYRDVLKRITAKNDPREAGSRLNGPVGERFFGLRAVADWSGAEGGHRSEPGGRGAAGARTQPRKARRHEAPRAECRTAKIFNYFISLVLKDQQTHGYNQRRKYSLGEHKLKTLHMQLHEVLLYKKKCLFLSQNGAMILQRA